MGFLLKGSCALWRFMLLGGSCLREVVALGKFLFEAGSCLREVMLYGDCALLRLCSLEVVGRP